MYALENIQELYDLIKWEYSEIRPALFTDLHLLRRKCLNIHWDKENSHCSSPLVRG